MLVDVIKPDSERWMKILAKMRHDFYHLPGYVTLEAERIGGEACAVLIEDGGGVLFLPLILRPIEVEGELVPGLDKARDAVSPYGYPCPLFMTSDERPADEFLEAALQSLTQKLSDEGVAAGFFRLHPLLEFPRENLQRHGTLVHHGQTVWIDLTVAEEELWQHTRKTYRNLIRRLKRDDFRVRLDDAWSSLPRFIEIYYQTMAIVKAEDYYYFSQDYFEKLRRALGPRISLCLVEKDGRIGAAGLFTECSGIVQYHLSCSDPDDFFKDATKLMLDFIRSWAKMRGNKYFHLGGGVGSQKDSLFFFKSGFSDLKSDFYSWRVIFNQQIYEAAVRNWEKKTGQKVGSIEEYFPPYRKP